MTATGENTGEAGQTPGTQKWVFDPWLTVADRKAEFQGSRHPGWGTLATTVQVEGAKARIVIAGQEQDWPVAPYPSGTVKTVYQQVVDISTFARRVAVGAASVRLPRVTMDLPIGASSATLVMEGASADGEFGGVCSDPSAGPDGCSPDPLRFFIGPELAARVEGRYGPEADLPNPAAVIAQLVPAPQVDAGGTWQFIDPATMIQGCPTSLQDDPNGAIWCLVDGVIYSTPMLAVPPNLFGTLCRGVSSCFAAGTPPEREVRKQGCISYRWLGTGEQPGWDRGPWQRPDGTWAGAGSPDCQQSILTYTWWDETTGAKSGNRILVFQAAWDSDWGFQDGPYDEFGIHWTAPKNKHMRWVNALSEDIPSYGREPFYASYFVDVYPKNSYGVPDAAAQGAYQNCFDPGVVARMRVHPEDSTGRAFGVGTGEDNGSTHGWPQWKTLTCSANTAYVRAVGSRLVALVEQHDFVGSRQADGHLLATFGHTRMQMTYRWGFKLEGPSCGFGPSGPGCSPFGVTFIEAEAETKSEVTKTTNSFGGFVYY